MSLFGKGYGPVAEVEPPKRLYEIEAIFISGKSEKHLILATGESEGLKKFLTSWIDDPENPVEFWRTALCETYKSVVIGSRRYQ